MKQHAVDLVALVFGVARVELITHDPAFDVHLVALPGRGEQAGAVLAEADRLYEQLGDRGLDVLYDDRDVSPGVKFADADLVGVPTQLVVGAKGLAKGIVERKDRATGTRDELPVGEVVDRLAARG